MRFEMLTAVAMKTAVFCHKCESSLFVRKIGNSLPNNTVSLPQKRGMPNFFASNVTKIQNHLRQAIIQAYLHFGILSIIPLCPILRKYGEIFLFI
jgi:hypothetical protein